MTSITEQNLLEPKIITITHHPKVPLFKIMEIYEKVDQISTFAVERDPRNPNRQRIIIRFEESEPEDDMDWNFNSYEINRTRNMNDRFAIADQKERIKRPLTTLKCLFPDWRIGNNLVNHLLHHFAEFGELAKHRIIYDDYGEPIIAYLQYQNGESARRARFWSDPIYRVNYCMEEYVTVFLKNESTANDTQKSDLKTNTQQEYNIDDEPPTGNAKRSQIKTIKGQENTEISENKSKRKEEK